MRFNFIYFSWLVLFVATSNNAEDCNWKMPEAEICTQKIKWKVHDDKQATATCLDYFPTTFVEGKKDNEEVKCTVYRQFHCKFLRDAQNNPVKAFLIFDKCYIFQSEEVTMKDYLDSNKADVKCKTGKIQGGLPTFFSMSQAKHVAKIAKEKNIAKMWVNVDKDGKTIDKSSTSEKAGFLLYQNPWKVHEGSYWAKDELMKADKFPDNVKYLFFRTKTDYLHSLYQGSFERASEESRATVVCEYQARIVPEQKRYCDKMKALGINAMYDDNRNRKRCLYTTLSKYSLRGTLDAIKKFPGCRERPSMEHSSGLDDGTAGKAAYETLTADGTFRVAAIKMNNELVGFNSNYATETRKKCMKNGNNMAPPTHKQRQPYQIYDHFYNSEYSSKMTSEWNEDYPMGVCSDFTDTIMDSNTLAIRKKKIIDIPVPVLLPAICSIETNVDCGLNSNACEMKGGKRSNDLRCKNSPNWNPENDLYVDCECVAGHAETEKGNELVCEWEGTQDACGRMHSEQDTEKVKEMYIKKVLNDNKYWHDIQKIFDFNLYFGDGEYSDQVDYVVVRKGCKLTVWSHPPSHKGQGNNYELVKDKEYGEYIVPNHKTGTLNGWDQGMSASATDCSCS